MEIYQHRSAADPVQIGQVIRSTGSSRVRHVCSAFSSCGSFVGFDIATGKFSARAVLERSEWNFVYHLHGSVHHSLPNYRVGMVEWRVDLSRSDFDDGGSRPPQIPNSREEFCGGRKSPRCTPASQFPN